MHRHLFFFAVIRRQKAGALKNSTLKLLESKHETDAAAKERELSMMERRINIEERRIRLEEEKFAFHKEEQRARWQLEKREREEKLQIEITEKRQYQALMDMFLKKVP